MKAVKCRSSDIPVQWAQLHAGRWATNYNAATVLPTPPPPERLEEAYDTSSSYLLDALNDDCLREIFECNVLEPTDLFEIVRTCNRLNGLVKSAFKIRFGTHCFAFDTNRWPYYRCEMLLRHFGPLITSIRVHESKVYEKIVLGMIGYHCRNLQRLECRRLEPISHSIAWYEWRQRNELDGPAPFGQLTR